MNPAIIILAYNRPKALARLLSSLIRANYESSKPTLVISVEYGADQEVQDIVSGFHSEKFEIQKIFRKVKYGLRNHIIECGSLVEEYESIIVLEDDLYVSKNFYQYARVALQSYGESDLIAGISLYSYSFNEFANLPFIPMRNGYSTHFMQIVSSWGQCWSRKQWASFYDWYENKSQEDLLMIDELPEVVKNWPESSWKKYFHGFIVSTNKFFVFPYESFTTNCSDSGGTHIHDKVTQHQVPFEGQIRENLAHVLCPLDCLDVLYDGHMEPMGNFIYNHLNLTASDVEIDIYGAKPLRLLLNKKYALTIKKGTDPIHSYNLDFKPHDFNVVFPNCNLDGDFFLTESKNIKQTTSNSSLYKRIRFYYGESILDKRILSILPIIFRDLVSRRLRSILKKLI